MKELNNSIDVYEAVQAAVGIGLGTENAESQKESSVENVHAPFFLPGTLRITKGALLLTDPTIIPAVAVAQKKGSNRAQQEIHKLQTARSKWDINVINGTTVRKPNGIFSSVVADSVTIDTPVAVVAEHPYKQGEESIWFRLETERALPVLAGSGSGDIMLQVKSFRFVNLELEMERGTLQFTPTGAPTTIEDAGSPNAQPKTTATFIPRGK